MANIKSQKKRILTNEKARLRNKAVKSSLKTHIRKFHEAAEAGDAAKAQKLAQVACRELDVAVSKGVIHKNQAANRKSAVASAAAALGRTSATSPRRLRPGRRCVVPASGEGDARERSAAWCDAPADHP